MCGLIIVPETLTFLIEEDGVEPRQETIAADFSDVPADVILSVTQQVPAGDVEAFTCALLAYRLNVPLDAAVSLLRGLQIDG